jgi:hypothetical protein
MIYSFVKDTCQKIAMISSFVEEGQHEITTTSSFVENIPHEIVMTFGFLEETPQEIKTSSFHEEVQLVVAVSDYHLIFNLNCVLVATIEGQTKFHPVVLKYGLKELIFICVKKFTMYNVTNTNAMGFIYLNVHP